MDNITIKKEFGRKVVTSLVSYQMSLYIKRDTESGLFIATKDDIKLYELVMNEQASLLPIHPKLSNTLVSNI